MEETGGSTSISVNSFVAARVKEIAALSLQISASSSVENKGLAFQHVPKHMRRRAVSHNVKRLPKRLQGTHNSQLAKSSGGPVKKPKKPSRKHRRRKRNLLSEYNRRQRIVKWLETHIWHAKRFHMETKWNHKIPISPCDKGYRSIYRAFRNYSAMRDLSFYTCLELRGEADLMSKKFRRISSQSTSPLGIGAALYKTRSRLGRLHIYAEIQYPFGYIGEIEFFWVDHNRLWIWVHPGIKDQLIAQLENLFQLSPQIEYGPKVKPPSLESQSIDQIKLEPKDIYNPPCWSDEDETVVLTDLYGTLNRIRLIGEGTLEVLKEILRCTPSTHLARLSNTDQKSWISDHFLQTSDQLTVQEKMWGAASKSEDFPPFTIFPLVVRDPRIFLPQTRAKREEAVKSAAIDENFEDAYKAYMDSSYVNPNPLTDQTLRERLVQEKMSDMTLCTRRGQLLIPGSPLDLGHEENQVPIILIRQDKTSWDLILPAGWTLAFWIALSYRCVRAFGYRDALHYAFEFDTVHSPEFPQPDSTFGLAELDRHGNEDKTKFFSYPPAKRENLVMLKCPFPFKIDWNLMLGYDQSRYVSQGLIDLPPQPQPPPPDHDEPWICSSIPSPSCGYFVLRNPQILRELALALRKCRSLDPTTDFKYIPISNGSKCLVGVELTMMAKGRPSAKAVICIPGTDEEIHLKTNTAQENPQNCHKLETARKLLRQKHQKEMAFLRKKRKKIRKRLVIHDASVELDQEGKNRDVNVDDFDSTQFSVEFNTETESMFTPDPVSALKGMGREPIGFVTVGGESYSVGRCKGFGYVTYIGLCSYLLHVNGWRRKNVVWVRDATKSLEYSVVVPFDLRRTLADRVNTEECVLKSIWDCDRFFRNPLSSRLLHDFVLRAWKEAEVLRNVLDCYS